MDGVGVGEIGFIITACIVCVNAAYDVLRLIEIGSDVNDSAVKGL